MHDDDGNELWDYRSRIYNRRVISVFIKEAESLLGNLIYFRKRFTGEGFPEKAEAVAFEGLTEDVCTIKLLWFQSGLNGNFKRINYEIYVCSTFICVGNFNRLHSIRGNSKRTTTRTYLPTSWREWMYRVFNW